MTPFRKTPDTRTLARSIARGRRPLLRIETMEDRTLMSATTAVIAPLGDVSAAYTPAQIRTAYGLNDLTFSGATADGKGQTIAIVVPFHSANIAADLDAFDQSFGRDANGSTLFDEYGPASKFLTVYNQAGKAIKSAKAAGPTDPSGTWAREVALDVEWAHAIAPGAKIALVEAKSDGSKDLFAAVKAAAKLPGVSVVSMGWGIAERDGQTASDSTFTTPAGHKGVTFLAPSGDAGSQASYPASSPNVVAVGGTSLQLGAAGDIQNESAWSGSSGGLSSQAVEPTYQLGIQTTGRRSVPDVAFAADPTHGVWVYNSDTSNAATPWTTLGGTSLGTPAWAGLIAVANQGRVATGGKTFNSTSNPTETQTALYHTPRENFRDITSGSNQHSSARPGYDAVTGLGSPIADRLLPDLATYRAESHLKVTAPTTAKPNKPFSLTVKVEDGSGKVVKGYNGDVTVALLNNPTGGFLGGPRRIKVVNGIATFKGLTLDNPAAGYQIVAFGGNVAPTSTGEFAVATGPAAKAIPLANEAAVPMAYGYDDDAPKSDGSSYGYDYYSSGDPSENYSTSGGPWYGNYGGPGNNGWDSTPINSLDYGYRDHDIAYANAGAEGIWGALTNTSVAGADSALSSTAWNSLWNDSSLNLYDSAWAVGTWGLFGGLGSAKQTVEDYSNTFSGYWNTLNSPDTWSSWNAPFNGYY